MRPITVVDDPEIGRLLDEAWGLFDRGDYGPGRLRLAEAQKISREDPRADFSLGLLNAMIDQDWRSAEEHFAACVRDPENVPSLNNLAVAQIFNRDVEGCSSTGGRFSIKTLPRSRSCRISGASDILSSRT